jgi:hypothetical protein
MRNFLLLMIAFTMLGCAPDFSDEPPGGTKFDKTGYRPIYQSETDVRKFVSVLRLR